MAPSGWRKYSARISKVFGPRTEFPTRVLRAIQETFLQTAPQKLLVIRERDTVATLSEEQASRKVVPAMAAKAEEADSREAGMGIREISTGICWGDMAKNIWDTPVM
jgi:hypothetical protein